MDEQQVYVFNQYYIDFLKKIKPIAKEKKEQIPEARRIIKSIRKNYPTMDKLTKEYVDFLNVSDFWKVYESQENETVFTEDFLKMSMYKDISVGDILKIYTEKQFVYYYICILSLFTIEDLPLTYVIDTIKCITVQAEFEEAIKKVTHESASKKLYVIHNMHTSKSKNLFEDELKEIENTSLGKLAKEIMKDIDLDALGSSMNDPNTNIFESLQNPNSGFGKVLGNVSKTMLSKLSSGELEKDVLLKDAIDLAKKLPNILPDNMKDSMGSQLGNIGDMLNNLQKMNSNSNSNGGSMPAGNTEMAEMMMNMMNLNKTQRKKATSHMEREEKKSRTSRKLQRKLQKRRENNNIQKEVEKADE